MRCDGNPSCEAKIAVRAIEVFTGAGGLALGIHRAGFEHVRFVENDGASCATLHVNRHVLGIDPQLQVMDPSGRPQYLLPEGARPIAELI